MNIFRDRFGLCESHVAARKLNVQDRRYSDTVTSVSTCALLMLLVHWSVRCQNLDQPDIPCKLLRGLLAHAFERTVIRYSETPGGKLRPRVDGARLAVFDGKVHLIDGIDLLGVQGTTMDLDTVLEDL